MAGGDGDDGGAGRPGVRRSEAVTQVQGRIGGHGRGGRRCRYGRGGRRCGGRCRYGRGREGLAGGVGARTASTGEGATGGRGTADTGCSAGAGCSAGTCSTARATGGSSRGGRFGGMALHGHAGVRRYAEVTQCRRAYHGLLTGPLTRRTGSSSATPTSRTASSLTRTSAKRGRAAHLLQGVRPGGAAGRLRGRPRAGGGGAAQDGGAVRSAASRRRTRRWPRCGPRNELLGGVGLLVAERERVHAGSWPRAGPCRTPRRTSSGCGSASGPWTSRRSAAAPATARPFAGEGVRVTIGETEANDLFLKAAEGFRKG
ncbi:hypothetical protein STANM309S_03421 [Streptomyces tanashiensis]